MKIQVFDTKDALGAAAAREAAAALRTAIAERGEARAIAATGASQFTFLDALQREPDIAWDRVTFFHLDEYVGLPDGHPASFRRYLRERIVEPLKPRHFEFVDGNTGDPEAECRRLEAVIRQRPIDVAFVGIGENGHLAFNDPPADFTTDRAYLVVPLDEACRRQQVGEGWFASLADVPPRAISMSIPEILRARQLLVIVPDARKAQAVHECFDGPVSPLHPASALQQHADVTVFLDRDSASKLNRATA
jgi:glucosamine-6-phosphate deaminase